MIVGAGTYSSPRAIDLTGDDILDIVIGGGSKEFEKTRYAVMAFNGASGDTLWTVKGINQIVGSAIFDDINEDNVPDVFIGGRSAQFFAIDGKTGKLLWEFLKEKDGLDLKRDTTLLNFFNPQFIPDQNNDGQKDLLVSFGGFVSAKPTDFDRPAGKLMVLDANTGDVLCEMFMPDLKETYMSPVVHDFDGDGKLTVIFGSGGETIRGNLYRIELEDLMSGDMTSLLKLDSGRSKGFIAPPVLADITSDNIKDIIVNSMEGKMIAYDGKSNKQIWQLDFGENAESQAMPTPGYFNDDAIPDFFSTFCLGTWPNIEKTIHVFIDGKNGQEMFRDTLGILQFSNAVVADINEDGYSDVVHIVNENDHPYDKHFQNEVRVYDLHSNKTYPLSKKRNGINLGSSPLITDLDSDGKMDLILCHMTNENNIQKFEHLIIERVELDVEFKDLGWNTYMGSNFSGKFGN
jgi:outer membrane protein assembly factor BamB